MHLIPVPFGYMKTRVPGARRAKKTHAPPIGDVARRPGRMDRTRIRGASCTFWSPEFHSLRSRGGRHKDAKPVSLRSSIVLSEPWSKFLRARPIPRDDTWLRNKRTRHFPEHAREVTVYDEKEAAVVMLSTPCYHCSHGGFSHDGLTHQQTSPYRVRCPSTARSIRRGLLREWTSILCPPAPVDRIPGVIRSRTVWSRKRGIDATRTGLVITSMPNSITCHWPALTIKHCDERGAARTVACPHAGVQYHAMTCPSARRRSGRGT
ncbi:hypothetical protein C8Q76DRAFT_451364 [Earliella scabrosa]|nr:hypothetical protein C8Q76DRAFT_451364 [Earliella scabrosa]